MRYRLTFAPTADRSFRQLPAWAKRAFDRTFDLRIEGPSGVRSGLDAHQLYGYRNVWTLRVPPFRGVCVIDSPDVVWVAFGARESVYAQRHALVPPDRQHIPRERAARR